MEAFRYRIVTEWSDEDQAFIARVPVLERCAAHSDTPEGAAKQAREAALAILESMRARGEAPPPPDASVDYSGQLRLRLPKSLHERIARLATAEGLSINSLLLSMIGEAVGHRRVAPKAPPSRRGYSMPNKAAARTPTRKRKAAAGSSSSR